MSTREKSRLIDPAYLALNDAADMAVEVVRVADTPALVIDGLYRNPDYVRSVALSLNYHREAGAYPGFFAFISISSRPLLALVNSLMSETIGHELMFTPFYQDDWSFAVVTKRGDELQPNQRRPHSDGFCDYAGLVYLNSPEQCFGGTSFWRERSTGRERASDAVDAAEGTPRSGSPTNASAAPAVDKDAGDQGTGYLIASNDSWEMTQVLSMAYNRFVLYRSDIFHSPLYDERDFGTTLETRRLTQNLYFNRAVTDG
jgi:hypothetical protein